MTTYKDYTPDEIAERGKAVYDGSIRSLVTEEDTGKYVVIDIETGNWLMGEDVSELSDQLHSRRPDAPLYAVRVGFRAFGRYGGRARTATNR